MLVGHFEGTSVVDPATVVHVGKYGELPSGTVLGGPGFVRYAGDGEVLTLHGVSTEQLDVLAAGMADAVYLREHDDPREDWVSASRVADVSPAAWGTGVFGAYGELLLVLDEPLEGVRRLFGLEV